MPPGDAVREARAAAPRPPKRVFVRVLAAAFVNFICAAFRGWAVVTYSLRPPAPGLSSQAVSKVFTFCTSLNLLAFLPSGLLAWHGPARCALVGVTLVLCGLISLSLSCREARETVARAEYVLGMSLIALGGPAIQPSIIHLSNLFPPCQRARVLTCLTAPHQLAFLTFILFDLLARLPGVSYASLFAAYAGVTAACLLLVLRLWPRRAYALVLQDEDSELLEALAQLQQHVPTACPDSDEEEAKAMGNSPSSSPRAPSAVVSVWQQLRHPRYLRLTAFFALASLWGNFYMASIKARLLLDREEEGLPSQYPAVTVAVMLGLLLLAALLAVTLLVRVFETAHGIVTAGFLCVTSGLPFLLGAALEEGESELVGALAFYSLFMCFLYAYFFVSLHATLGPSCLPILSGVSFGIAGAAHLLLPPLIQATAGRCLGPPGLQPCDIPGGWRLADACQLVLLLCLYTGPCLDLVLLRRGRKATGEDMVVSEQGTWSRGDSSLSGPLLGESRSSLDSEQGGCCRPSTPVRS